MIALLTISYLFRLNGEGDDSWYFLYLILFPIFLIAFKSIIGDREGFANGFKIVKLMSLPYIIAEMYSLFLSFAYAENRFSMYRGLIFSILFVYTALIGMAVYMIFKDDVVNVISDSIIIAYMLCLVRSVFNIGIVGLISYMYAPEASINKHWFELHDAGLSVGLLIVYHLQKKGRNYIIRIVFLIAILYLCHKRIAIFGVLLTSIVMIMLNKYTKESKYALLRVLLFVLFVFCFLLVLMISTGYLYTIADYLGIDLSGRRYLYKAIAPYYEWKINYIGHGFGYTDKLFSRLGGVGMARTTSIHSDILKIYIELGFWGAVLWFAYSIWLIPNRFRKYFGSRTEWVYCFLTMYTYCIYSVDNVLSYYIYRLFFVVILLESTVSFSPKLGLEIREES